MKDQTFICILVVSLVVALVSTAYGFKPKSSAAKIVTGRATFNTVEFEPVVETNGITSI